MKYKEKIKDLEKIEWKEIKETIVKTMQLKVIKEEKRGWKEKRYGKECKDAKENLIEVIKKHKKGEK